VVIYEVYVVEVVGKYMCVYSSDFYVFDSKEYCV
jgi:hypothetical protein